MLTKTFNPDRMRDLLQMKAIAQRRPLSCTFELTYHCNFRCPMCYIRMTDVQAKPYGRLRTVEEWLDMARQVREAGVLYLNLTGGECTQYPGFAELYEKFCRMGFRVSLMSNAGAYTEKLRDLFRAYPPYGVAITLYGGSNETYEKVTGDPKGLDKVLGNIRFFKELGVNVSLNYTAIRQNIHDYPKVGMICKELNIPYSIIMDITAHTWNPAYSDALNSKLTPAQQACLTCHTPEEVEEALKDAEELEKELVHFTLLTAKADAAPEINACIGSYSSTTIFWNGEMQTCPSMEGKKPCYKPFEIGFEAAWQQLQGNHAERFQKSPVCASCEMQEDCVHSCSARNLEGTGDCQTPDPEMCKYVWLLRQYRLNGKHKSSVEPRTCI